MYVARTLDELVAAVAALGPDLALIPTMGALHLGHLSLLSAAGRESRHVAASIFVNPTQFNQGDDLARYPRDEDSDLALLRDAGCDLAWLPSVEIMYPGGDEIRIVPGSAALGWEGDARPGHFSGVATVVAKLLNQVRPACAFFGEKDWQQLQVIRSIVEALFIPVRIEGVATKREADGLAMSSRNRFLTPLERQRAPALHRCLRRLARAIADGDEVDVCLATAREDLRLQGFSVEYLALVAASSLQAIAENRPGARLLAAARLGSVRLLDNLAVSPLR
ncbi:pantoate--beta-alanine ligase [Lichenicoccus sp.]|uniref:pantoate--beta-alanine ligase n=1 Tax=Lichenicoccus sp. TaxID=2781899 RepID=UPI003D0B2956